MCYEVDFFLYKLDYLEIVLLPLQEPVKHKPLSVDFSVGSSALLLWHSA